MLASQPTHKLQIRIRLGPAQLMIKMNHSDHDPNLAPQLQQQPQQRHRIDPAGNGHAHAVAGAQQFLPPDVTQNALRQFTHGNMVQPSAHALETPASAARRTNPVAANPQQ
jgi:hypothetical protein